MGPYYELVQLIKYSGYGFGLSFEPRFGFGFEFEFESGLMQVYVFFPFLNL